MAAARTQKQARANARKAPAGRGSSTRSTSRSSARTSASSRSSRATGASSVRSSARRSPARTSTTSRGGSRAKAKTAGAARRRGRQPGRIDLRLATGAIVASILVAAWTIYPVLRIQYQEQRKMQTLQAELTGLQERNAELRAQVDALKTPEGIEQAARESLGLVKPGEQAYVVTGGEETTAVTAYDGPGGASPFLQRVLDAVFGFD